MICLVHVEVRRGFRLGRETRRPVRVRPAAVEDTTRKAESSVAGRHAGETFSGEHATALHRLGRRRGAELELGSGGFPEVADSCSLRAQLVLNVSCGSCLGSNVSVIGGREVMRPRRSSLHS